MLTEIVYTWPDGREEVRYRRPRYSPEADELIKMVKSQQEKYGADNPYSFRHVLWATGKDAIQS
jgi:hypothetical protein